MTGERAPLPSRALRTLRRAEAFSLRQVSGSSSYVHGVRAIQILSAGALAFSVALARPSAAQAPALERSVNDRTSAQGSDVRAAEARQNRPESGEKLELTVPPRQLRRQPRLVHPNYVSLVAGVVLLGFSYAVALSDPLRHGFDGESGRRAIPIAGPWFPQLTWPWALDGVLQAGGVAFITNAFVQPVTVLGTPTAHFEQTRTPQLRLSWRLEL